MKEKYFSIKDQNTKIGCRLDDTGDLQYQHPLSGSWCNNKDQFFYNWSTEDGESETEYLNLLKEFEDSAWIDELGTIEEGEIINL